MNSLAISKQDNEIFPHSCASVILIKLILRGIFLHSCFPTTTKILVSKVKGHMSKNF